jgi:hypothetical protein
MHHDAGAVKVKAGADLILKSGGRESDKDAFAADLGSEPAPLGVDL